MTRPPRGWLFGVVLTIFIFWFSGLTWDKFRNGELSSVTLAGAFIMIIALSMEAHQALTNDDYKTSKPYRIGKLLAFVGFLIAIVGERLA